MTHANESRDGEILSVVSAKMGTRPKDATYDASGNLISLDLTDLKLTDLPAEIGQLTSLQVLDLGKNQLTEFPSWIGQLTSLQHLS